MVTEKTWTQLQDDIEESFRKWHLDMPLISCALPKRSAAKRTQTEEERTVTIAYRYFIDRKGWTDVRLTVKRAERAIDNLALIAKATELMRLASVRNVTDLIVLIYRQTHPQPPTINIKTDRVEFSSASSSAQPGGPYAVLYVARSAPLPVCEAAYRALAKLAHPDQGGSTATMQRLNAAIEHIRKEKTS